MLGITAEDLKASFRTFVITLVVTVGPGFLGFIHDVSTWANTNGQGAFPDGKNLSYLLVSGVIAAFVAAGTLLWRVVENWLGKGLLREVPPK